MIQLHGVFPPLATPFETEKVAIKRLQKNLEILGSFELTGYVLLGTNGEAPLLHELEKVQLIKTARMLMPDDKTLIVGSGMETINATVRMSKIAAEYGADALLIITPFYFKGQMNSAALSAYFREVADKVKLPLLLYNVPKVTGISLDPSVVAELSDHERIIGIKDSSGDMQYILKLLAAIPADFPVLSGNASTFAPALAAGATGGILGIANALPEPFVEICNEMKAGNSTAAFALQKLVLDAIRVSIGSNGVPGVKAMMDIRGLYGGPPRKPLQPVDNDTYDKIHAAVTALKDAGAISHESVL